MVEEIIKTIKSASDEDIINYLDSLLTDTYDNETGDNKKDDALWSDVYDILFSHDYADEYEEDICITFDGLISEKYPDFEIHYPPNLTEKGIVLYFMSSLKDYIKTKKKQTTKVKKTFDQFIKEKTINW